MSPASASHGRSPARTAAYRPTALPAALSLLFLVFFAHAGHTAPPAPEAMAQPSQTAAVIINVTTTKDELNQDGDCSLREAVQAANTDAPVDGCPAGGGNDTILLAAGTYSLTLTGRVEDANATGDLDIHSTIQIWGTGPTTTILNGNQIDRLLHIHSGASATLRGLAIIGGRADETGHGGGILNQGTLTFFDGVLDQNHAGNAFHQRPPDFQNPLPPGGSGGGIANEGDLFLEAVRITENAAGQGYCEIDYIGQASFCVDNGTGGGVWNQGRLEIRSGIIAQNEAGGGGGIANFGQLTVTGGEISGNKTWEAGRFGNGHGGGLLNEAQSQVVNVQITDNLTGDGLSLTCRRGCWGGNGGSGAGIFNRGGMTITHSLISGNGTGVGGYSNGQSGNGGDGGGIFNRSRLVVEDSVIAGNVTGSSSGSLNSDWNGEVLPPVRAGDGAGIANHGDLHLLRTSIVDNRGGDGCLPDWITPVLAGPPPLEGIYRGGEGGAIINHGTLTATQITSSGNAAGNGGQHAKLDRDQCLPGDGGAIYNHGSLHLSFATIYSNTGGTIPYVDPQSGPHSKGGGLFNAEPDADKVQLTGVVFSANVAPGDGPNCAGSPITSLGYNLIEASQGCTITGTLTATSTDILDQPALLGPLADNGGPTLTHEPLAASPAVDGGPASACGDGDQRGVFRPQGAACDIGSMERVLSGVAGPQIGASLHYTEAKGVTVHILIPAGAFSAPIELFFRPTQASPPPDAGWAATDLAFDLVTRPADSATGVGNRSDLRPSLPLQIEIYYDWRIFADTPIIPADGLILMHRDPQGPWLGQPGVENCSGVKRTKPNATNDGFATSTCYTGHFLVAGRTHAQLVPLIFSAFVPSSGE